jgi:hypothetical protein
MPSGVKKKSSAPAPALKYEFRACFRSPLDPNVVAARLEWLRTRLSRDPEGQDVLEDARPVGSPLHDHFDWNDYEAGEKHRLGQATDLINAIRVTVYVVAKPKGRVKQLLPAYVRLKNPAGRRTFVAATIATATPRRAETLAETIIRYAHMATRDRALGLTELDPLFDVIDKLKKRYG